MQQNVTKNLSIHIFFQTEIQAMTTRQLKLQAIKYDCTEILPHSHIPQRKG